MIKLVGFLLAQSAAFATVVNFDTFPGGGLVPAGTAVTSQWSSLGVTFTPASGSSIFVYSDAASLSINPPFNPVASTPNVICATEVFAGTGKLCSNFTIDFAVAVSGFSIDVFGWDAVGTQIVATFLTTSGTSTATINSPQLANDKVRFSSGLTGILRVAFSAFTDPNGNAFDNVNFTPDIDGGGLVGGVPEPSTLALGALGVLAMVAKRLRR